MIKQGSGQRRWRISRLIRGAFITIAFMVSVVGCADSTPHQESTDNESAAGVAIAKSAGYQAALQKLTTDPRGNGSAKVIVGFSPRGGGSAATANDILQSTPGNVRNVKNFKYIPFMALTVDSHALTGLSHNPNVTSISEDIKMKPDLSSSVPLIGGTAAWADGFSGTGQAVAILDTGVDGSHPFLSGKVVAEACFSYTNAAFDYSSTCPNGQDAQVGAGSGSNCNLAYSGCDHGTHVAGIAAGSQSLAFSGVAKDANVIAIQVFTYDDLYNDVSAFTSDIILGLEKVIELSGSVTIASVNMSLGSSAYSGYCDSADGGATKAVIDQLAAKGIATVIASGNGSNKSGISWPACISTAISVGATTVADTVASFSNSASILDILAPGVSTYSSVPGGGFATKSGTSMAAPHVAGAWAVIKQSGAASSVVDILSLLQTTGVGITDSNGIRKSRIQIDAAILSSQLAIMASPSNGATLSGASQVFTWNDVGAEAYSMWIGRANGTHDLFAAYTTSPQTVTGLPTDGSPIYVRLWSRFNGVWYYNNYTYTTSKPNAATMASPSNGATLSGASQVFTWNDVGAEAYSMWVGRANGTYDLFAAYTTSPQTVTGLPTDGSPIYVRLWSRFNGVWYYNNYTYTTSKPNAATMVSPSNGATLSGASQVFTWNDVGAEAYSMWVGRANGTYDLFAAYTTSPQTVTGLPTDGSPIYVRLWSRFNGVWYYNSYTYTSSKPNTAIMASPSNGATLTGASQLFTWNDVGAEAYSMWVGRANGTYDLFAAYTTSPQTVTGLPTDGSPIYVRLWSRFNGVWYYNNYTYTTSKPNAAIMASPSNGATLTGASQLFTWNDVGAEAYSMWVGRANGTYDLFAAYTTSPQTVTGLPTDGSPIYVRLWSRFNGVWHYNSYTYTSKTGP